MSDEPKLDVSQAGLSCRAQLQALPWVGQEEAGSFPELLRAWPTKSITQTLTCKKLRVIGTSPHSSSKSAEHHRALCNDSHYALPAIRLCGVRGAAQGLWRVVSG